jgi:hypothetical protein
VKITGMNDSKGHAPDNGFCDRVPGCSQNPSKGLTGYVHLPSGFFMAELVKIRQPNGLEPV